MGEGTPSPFSIESEMIMGSIEQKGNFCCALAPRQKRNLSTETPFSRKSSMELEQASTTAMARPWLWPQVRSILLLNLILVAFGGWCAVLSSRTERIVVTLLAILIWRTFYLRRIRSQRHQPNLPELG